MAGGRLAGNGSITGAETGATRRESPGGAASADERDKGTDRFNYFVASVAVVLSPDISFFFLQLWHPCSRFFAVCVRRAQLSNVSGQTVVLA